ncbi:MAG: protein YgfX [Dokdonella sp.]
MKSVPTIGFDYRPSRGIAAALLLVCAAAMLAPWLSALPASGSAVVSVTVVALGVRAARALLYPSFRRVAYRASGWMLVDLANQEHEVLLESHARLGAMIALRFRHGPRERFNALLAPDNLDAETRRRLILLLSRAEFARDQ